MTSTPIIWIKLMRELFGAPDRFACQVWRHSDVSPTLLWQLSVCDTHDTDRHGWVARVRRLSDLLPPAALLAASLATSPETGKPRAREALQFEEAILRMTDRSGHWRW